MMSTKVLEALNDGLLYATDPKDRDTLESIRQFDKHGNGGG